MKTPKIEELAPRVEQLALTPGEKEVTALFALLAEDNDALHGFRSRELVVRGVASRLAYAQSQAVLLARLKNAGDAAEEIELLACWMHDVVLKGHALDAEPAARAFQERLARMNHPLTQFPLKLTTEEREAPTYMPMYGAQALEAAAEALGRGPTSTHTIPPPDDHDTPKALPLENAAEIARIQEAVQPWLAGSNGKAETRVFSLTAPLETGLGRTVLRSLPLVSVRGDDLHVSLVTTDVVWGALFAAASNGGAYSQGIGGAYGRRAAWISLGALAGAKADASPADIAAVAKATSFAMFEGTEFFGDVAWDLGVAALRADKKRLAVLAATDVD